jgi:MATE family multidrug resistance protein
VTLLRLASLYTLADAMQLVYAGSLRGAGDTAWVMRFSIMVHWTLAALSLLLVKVVVADPVLVWCVFIGMIITLGCAMYLRFRGGAWRKIRLIE